MRRILIVVAVMALLISGCVTTSVHDEWRDPGYTPHPVRSALVLGIPTNAMIGNLCTDEFVRQLKERGISAIPGYNEIPAGMPKEAVMAKARELHRDAVIVCRYMERKKQLEVYPSGGDMMFLGPDMEMWPPYEYVQNEYDVFRTIFYDPVSGKAAWSAVSETFAETSVKKILNSYVKKMLKKMEKEGILGREEKH